VSDRASISARRVGHTLLEVSGSRMDHLYGHDLEPPVLKPTDDLPDEVALDAVGLDHDEAALSMCRSAGFVGFLRVALEKSW